MSFIGWLILKMQTMHERECIICKVEATGNGDPGSNYKGPIITKGKHKAWQALLRKSMAHLKLKEIQNGYFPSKEAALLGDKLPAKNLYKQQNIVQQMKPRASLRLLEIKVMKS